MPVITSDAMGSTTLSEIFRISVNIALLYICGVCPTVAPTLDICSFAALNRSISIPNTTSHKKRRIPSTIPAIKPLNNFPPYLSGFVERKKMFSVYTKFNFNIENLLSVKTLIPPFFGGITFFFCLGGEQG
jgi:hypothetical protein